MKTILLYVCIICSMSASATNYYFSSTGSDANNGTSATTPWKTLARFNSMASSLKAGDNIFLARGSVFYGNMVITKSGTAASPITITAYGSGNMPIISGFTPVASWVNAGGNIWESTAAVSTLAYTNMVVVNNGVTPMGRYPNTGYFIYTNPTSTPSYSVTSSSLNSGVTNWTGAELVAYNTTYTIIRNPITSQSGSTVYFTHNTADADFQAGITQNFFIQNDVRTLDVQNEWYYNPSTKKLRMYSVGTPANVQVAAVETLADVTGQSYITFDNVSFQGSNTTSVQTSNAQHLTIQNCDFNFSGSFAVYAPYNGSGYLTVQNCNFNHTQNQCLQLGSATNAVIRANTIKNTGTVPGMMSRGGGASQAVSTVGANTIIEKNIIDSTGYAGINFFGNNTLVDNNYITSFCLMFQDGGGIYTFNGWPNTTNSGMKILNNVILYGGDDDGIYLDDKSNGIEVAGNTTATCRMGIYLHNNWNINIHNNTSYNNSGAGLLFNNYNTSITTRDVAIKNNIFFAATTSQKASWFALINGSIAATFLPDSNYYLRPMDDNLTVYTDFNQVYTLRTVSQWASVSNRDLHSHTSPKSITTATDLRFEYNATSSPKTVSLDANYIDAKNVAYNGSITLAPYTSSVLMKSGAINKPPVCNAGTDQVITLPASTALLSGSGTDTDGTIASYSWTKISGPAAGTITNPAAASTSITGMAKGTYLLQLNVTDNSAASAKDTLQIIVNPAANVPPLVNAGGDQTITLPGNSISLSGIGADTDGTIVSYIWFQISGPASATIANSTSANTNMNDLIAGVYQFKLTVTDNAGASASDAVQVTVNQATNVPPVSNAGNDQSIKLPASIVTLSGKATDANGTVISYQWSQISGPATCNIVNTNSLVTDASGLIQGTYQFQLMVTDNNGANDLDTVQITVGAASFLLPSLYPSSIVNGLDYKYYEGSSYSMVPAFASTSPVATGTTLGFDISVARRTYIFAMNFTGYINVPADGQYTFFTTSDDGSYLYIDSIMVVNNDSYHPATEQSGTIGLKAGMHSIAVGYFNQYGGKILTASYAGPGITKQAIPGSSLYRVLPIPANVTNGLDYKYYQGTNYSAIPAFDSITPVKTGNVTGFDISVATRSYTFAINFTGNIFIPADGLYTFYTTSDDGSYLYIDSNMVVNNDGHHAALEKSGTVRLMAGMHNISAGYFNQYGGQVLNVSYESKITAKQSIPLLSLYRNTDVGFMYSKGSNSISTPAFAAATQPVIKSYPNPFVNTVNVNISGDAGKYKLILTDASGRKMWAEAKVKTAGMQQETINTSTLTSGAYYLNVIQNNKNTVIKLVK